MPIYKLSKSKQITLVIFSVLIIFILIYIFKDNSKNVSQNTSAAPPAFQTQKNSTTDQEVNPKNVSNNTNAQKQSDHPSEQETLYDTKSDLTIQPIDPEKDPGNQSN